MAVVIVEVVDDRGALSPIVEAAPVIALGGIVAPAGGITIVVTPGTMMEAP